MGDPPENKRNLDVVIPGVAPGTALAQDFVSWKMLTP